jgi:hypothetical protein
MGGEKSANRKDSKVESREVRRSKLNLQASLVSSSSTRSIPFPSSLLFC